MKKTLFFVALATALGFNNAQAVDWNWKGDFRYRYESKYNDDQDHSRDRHRLRLRFGVAPTINDELSAGIRIATGGKDEPLSRNQTLQDGFSAKNIWVDEAFINYHPKFLEGNVNAVLGKRDVAKTLFVEKDLVWDSDVTLEGATLQYGKAVDGKQKEGLGAVVGYYVLDENSSVTTNEQDPYLFVAQGAYKGKVSDMGFDLGVGYYDFVHYDYNITDITPKRDYTGKDFNIVEFFGSIGGDITKTVPWKLYGQYAFNTASHSDHVNIDDSERDAYLIGLKIGKAKVPGQFEGSAEYVRIEQDAVSLFTDADRNASSSTNLKGFKLAAGYQVIQNMKLGLTYMNFQNIIGAAGTNHLFQADVVATF